VKWLENLREQHQQHVKEREADGKKGSVFFLVLRHQFAIAGVASVES
jgi:hypothetical protein